MMLRLLCLLLPLLDPAIALPRRDERPPRRAAGSVIQLTRSDLLHADRSLDIHDRSATGPGSSYSSASSSSGSGSGSGSSSGSGSGSSSGGSSGSASGGSSGSGSGGSSMGESSYCHYSAGCGASSSSGPGNAGPSNGNLYQQEAKFLAIIQAGNGVLSVIADTGSNDLAIAQSTYDGSSDPDWQDLYTACSDMYGAARKSYYGNGWNVPVTVAGQSAEVAICLAGSADITGYNNGVMGLATYAAGNTIFAHTGSNVPASMGWSSFGLYLSVNGYGELTPNAADGYYYTGDWTYESTPGNGLWAIGYASYSIGNATGSPTINSAIIDSGNPMINLDQASVNNIYSQIDFTGYTAPLVDCSQSGVAPALELTAASGTKYTIPSTSYIQQMANGQCMVFIRPGSNPRGAVFGHPFLYTYYALFDIDNSQIGFSISQ